MIIQDAWDQQQYTLFLVKAKQTVSGAFIRGNLKNSSRGILFFLKDSLAFSYNKTSAMVVCTLSKKQLVVDFGKGAFHVTVPSGKGGFDIFKTKECFDTAAYKDDQLKRILTGSREFEAEVVEIYGVITNGL